MNTPCLSLKSFAFAFLAFLSFSAISVIAQPLPILVTQTGAKVSMRGVTPWEYSGNFRGVDACQELADLGFAVNLELGVGRKIDNWESFSNDRVNFYSPDGIHLNWTATNAYVQAVVVKGGNNFNLYNYLPFPPFPSDEGLTSPLNGGDNYPNISHYAFCYVPLPPPTGNGCTPGYWRNHMDRWVLPSGFTPNSDFDAVFGVSLYGPGVSLVQVISCPQTYGAFGFHAVAALLNSTGGTPNKNGTSVTYPYTTAQVISMVQEQVAGGTLNHSALATANELGCPLGGTRAVRSLVSCPVQ